jgi:hypothetical protein
MSDDLLLWLQQWYGAHCDGDWEHEYGVRLTSLDNPGWSLWIYLHGTELEQKPFKDFEVERTANDWVQCRTKPNEEFSGFRTFEAYGGVTNLSEMLQAFRAWVES